MTFVNIDFMVNRFLKYRIKEKHSIWNIIKKKIKQKLIFANKNANNSPEEMGLTVYKERFIKKIFNLIKGIFKK